MDIDLLSRMISELIVDHDQVGLPGVGTFVAEVVPASFSDKGYTINPPYRRLSFYSSRLEDNLLIDLYAESNQISQEAASAYLTQYLAELKAVLEERKTIVLPGLGRLRATRENTLFFVPDADLDIFPNGVGLKPVSLKSHVVEEPVVIDVPVPTPQEEVTPVEIPEPIAAEPEPEVTEPESQPEPEPEVVPEEPVVTEPEPVVTEPEPEIIELGGEPEPEPAPEPERLLEVVEMAPEPEEVPAEEPAEEPVEEPAAEPVQEPEEEPVQEPEEAPAPQPAIAKPQWLHDDWQEPEPKGLPGWVTLLIILGALLIVGLVAFMILARLAPDFIDSILYTPDQLRIINF